MDPLPRSFEIELEQSGHNFSCERFVTVMISGDKLEET
jgi:hypothetical protein